MRKRTAYALATVTVLMLALGAMGGPAFPQTEDRSQILQAPPTDGSAAPEFRVDPFWPRPLPNDWILGQVAGVDTDSQDDVWILQRPGSLDPYEGGAALDPPESNCCVPAPPIIEFDAEGNVKRAWGGPGEGYDWPENEHGLFIDHLDNVWIGGNGENDHQVLKFASDGTFLLQIGQPGETGGSDDTALLGNPADISVDPERNEVYIADGYINHRVIVFDAETGEYKRHWGAYGEPPTDEEIVAISDTPERIPAPDQFGNPVHCVVLTEDGLVYVCDRANNRIQVFRKNGTFVREFFIERDTLGNGSTWDMDVSPDAQQTFLYDADGTNQYVWTLLRDTEEVLSTLGRPGRYAGQFHWVHNLAVDSFGDLYTAEVDTGKRVQKFELVGYRATED